jgi:hypothetical protein
MLLNLAHEMHQQVIRNKLLVWLDLDVTKYRAVFPLDEYTCQCCYVGQARGDSHLFVPVMTCCWIFNRRLLKGRLR